MGRTNMRGVVRTRTPRYPQLGPELQFENDPEVLRRAFRDKGIRLPEELREGEDPRAETFEEWKD